MIILFKVFNLNKIKFELKGIKLICFRVVNINDLLFKKMIVDEFRDVLVKYFVENEDSIFEEILYEKYVLKFEELRKLFSFEKWIYDCFVNFIYIKIEKFFGGFVIVYGIIENLIIKDIIFVGDFLSKKDICEVELLFKGICYDEKLVREVFVKIDLENYFGILIVDEIVKIILG